MKLLVVTSMQAFILSTSFNVTLMLAKMFIRGVTVWFLGIVLKATKCSQ